MPDLIIQITEPHNWVIVKIAGDAGLAEADTLDAHLNRLAKANPKAVIFELSGLNFISSIGMGAMVSFRNAIIRSGGKVRVAAMQPLVEEAFRRARLVDLFDSHPSLEAALT